MVTAPARDPCALGPATEALIVAAFQNRALATPKDAARALGFSERTLREMADKGVIRSVIIGASTRRYTEADLRAFLAGERPPEREQPCQSTSRRKAVSGGGSHDRNVADIRDILAARRGKARAKAGGAPRLVRKS